MTNGTAKLATAIATVAVACQQFTANYDIEFHLEPDRPSVSAVWDVNEELPERLR